MKYICTRLKKTDNEKGICLQSYEEKENRKILNKFRLKIVVMKKFIRKCCLCNSNESECENLACYTCCTKYCYIKNAFCSLRSHKNEILRLRSLECKNCQQLINKDCICAKCCQVKNTTCLGNSQVFK